MATNCYSHLFSHFLLFLSISLSITKTLLPRSGLIDSYFFPSPESCSSHPLITPVNQCVFLFSGWSPSKMPPAASTCRFLFLSQSQSIFTFPSPHKVILKTLLNNIGFMVMFHEERIRSYTECTFQKAPKFPLCRFFALLPKFLFFKYFLLLMQKTLSLFPCSLTFFSGLA